MHSRLAELEIAKFQDQVIKRLRDDMASQLDASLAHGAGVGGGTSPVTGAIILHHEPNEMEWTLPKAFLYSLTVLTTIGKWWSGVGCSVHYGGTVCLFICLLVRERNERKSDSPTQALKG